jgi:hypothetical protein
VAIAFLAWLADRGRQLGECTQHDLDEWFATGPTTRRHVIAFLSWARQQRIICDVDVPVISTEGAGACPPGPDARLAAIRRLLLDETLAPGDRIAGCLVALYGQQVSRIAALRTTDTSCAAGATRLKLGADWLDVPGPVATLLREHLRNRSNMTTAANPASSWLFPGSSPANIAATAGSSACFTNWASLPGRAGWPPGASSSATHHPRSSPARSASHRAQRCATRSSAAPTGPPTPLEDVLTPRTTRRRSHRDGVSPSASERACNIRLWAIHVSGAASVAERHRTWSWVQLGQIGPSEGNPLSWATPVK